MHTLFPYLVSALAFVAFSGLVVAVNSTLAFRADVRAWQAAAEARFVRAHAKLQDGLRLLELAGERRDIALERQAGELMHHRLSAPPPRMIAPGPSLWRAAQTSEDWQDDGRSTQVRPSAPPPLPAFDRPGYMSR